VDLLSEALLPPMLPLITRNLRKTFLCAFIYIFTGMCLILISFLWCLFCLLSLFATFWPRTALIWDYSLQLSRALIGMAGYFGDPLPGVLVSSHGCGYPHIISNPIRFDTDLFSRHRVCRRIHLPTLLASLRQTFNSVASTRTICVFVTSLSKAALKWGTP